MMSGVYRPTAHITRHARERCAEMGISTKVAKAILRKPTLTHPTRPRPDWKIDGERRVATSQAFPSYAVVYAPGEPDVVISVLFRTQVRYVRNGTDFIVVVDDDG